MTPDEAKKIVLAEHKGAIHTFDLAKGTDETVHAVFNKSGGLIELLATGNTEPEAWINAAENIKERK